MIRRLVFFMCAIRKCCAAAITALQCADIIATCWSDGLARMTSIGLLSGATDDLRLLDSKLLWSSIIRARPHRHETTPMPARCYGRFACTFGITPGDGVTRRLSGTGKFASPLLGPALTPPARLPTVQRVSVLVPTRTVWAAPPFGPGRISQRGVLQT